MSKCNHPGCQLPATVRPAVSFAQAGRPDGPRATISLPLVYCRLHAPADLSSTVADSLWQTVADLCEIRGIEPGPDRASARLDYAVLS